MAEIGNGEPSKGFPQNNGDRFPSFFIGQHEHESTEDDVARWRKERTKEVDTSEQKRMEARCEMMVKAVQLDSQEEQQQAESKNEGTTCTELEGEKTETGAWCICHRMKKMQEEHEEMPKVRNLKKEQEKKDRDQQMYFDLMRRINDLERALVQINGERDTKERKTSDDMDKLAMKLAHVDAILAVNREQQERMEVALKNERTKRVEIEREKQELEASWRHQSRMWLEQLREKERAIKIQEEKEQITKKLQELEKKKETQEDVRQTELNNLLEEMQRGTLKVQELEERNVVLLQYIEALQEYILKLVKHEKFQRAMNNMLMLW